MRWRLPVVVALPVLFVLSCLTEDQMEFRRAFTAGKVVYNNNCRNCHGENGEGLSALMPPLTDTLYLKKNAHLLPCIVKNGLTDTLIIVHGKAYQNLMPPTDLAPVEIAQVLTYIGNSFGNNTGLKTLDTINKQMADCK